MNEINKKQYIEKQIFILNDVVGALLKREWNNNQEIEKDIGLVTELLRKTITVATRINGHPYNSFTEQAEPIDFG